MERLTNRYSHTRMERLEQLNAVLDATDAVEPDRTGSDSSMASLSPLGVVVHYDSSHRRFPEGAAGVVELLRTGHHDGDRLRRSVGGADRAPGDASGDLQTGLHLSTPEAIAYGLMGRLITHTNEAALTTAPRPALY